MAKTPYTKIRIKLTECAVPVQIGDYTIAVRSYLPVQEKLKLIGKVITQAHEQDANYSNPVKVEIITDLEMIFAYSDISFTDKQKEDLPTLYDELYVSGIKDTIINAIPKAEREIVLAGIKKSIDSIYQYQNSVLGILDTIGTDYSNLNLDITELQQKLANAENLDIVKDVVTKLG